MPEQPAQPVTELLILWRSGDQQALDQLVPLIYSELRGFARLQLNRERPGHTLQSAALVHQAYLRLLGQIQIDTEDRTHFLMVAVRLMRQILVDHTRSQRAAKRGASVKPFTLTPRLFCLNPAPLTLLPWMTR